MRCLIEILSSLLHSTEREAVLGDLAEAGDSPARSLFSLLGLVLRRQMQQLYRSVPKWSPWMALFFIVPLGHYMSLGVLRVSGLFGFDTWLIRNYKDLDPSILAENGFSLHGSVIALLLGSIILAAGCWLSGAAIGWLSRRAMWFQWLLLSVIVGFNLAPRVLRYGDLNLLISLACFALLPWFLGVRFGRRRGIS